MQESGLGDTEQELLAAVEDVRGSHTSQTIIVHGWKITWSVRPGHQSVARGDLCIVDPRDGHKFYSVISLKRRLGLEPSAAAHSMESNEAAPDEVAPDEVAARPQLRRAIKSTTVMVNGHAVKRANMYTMDTGESSVWDQELGDSSASPTLRDARPPPQPVAKKPRSTSSAPAAAPSAQQVRRQQRNELLRQFKAQAAAHRAAFLSPHAKVLARFGAAVPSAAGGLTGRPSVPGPSVQGPSVPPSGQAAPAECDEAHSDGGATAADSGARGDGAESGGAGGGATAFDLAMVACGTIPPPAELKVEMREYQLHGLRWLCAMHRCGVNAILADEMGLGKTLQTIALLAHVRFTLGEPGPHLVVAPLSVLSAWTAEFRRFCPAMRVLKLHSSDGEERARLMATVEDCDAYDVAITTPEMAKAPNVQSKLAHRSWWNYLVIDEGHVVKNDASQVSQALRKFHCARCVLLTGTPLQNNLHELWALLNFLYPETFPSSTAFDAAFDLARGEVDSAQLTAASALLRPFMLRRTKAEVEKGLPPKLETSIACPLSEMQTFWYKRLLLKDSTLLAHLEGLTSEAAAASGSTSADWKKLSSLLMQLRKCCNHPYLFPDVEPPPGSDALEELVAASGKLQLLDRLLARLHANGHRVVLFSQFTSMLDLLEQYLSGRGYECASPPRVHSLCSPQPRTRASWPASASWSVGASCHVHLSVDARGALARRRYCRLDGSTNRVQRTVDINAFNVAGSSRFVFLMSTRAGGLGINCQTADTCILFDSDWNPQVRPMCRPRL